VKPQRPYLVRAFYDWIVDSGCTPHLLVDAALPGVEVPADAVNDGRIVLNVSPDAVRHFVLGDELISFECRFNGVPRSVCVPHGAILAVYARENGAGMAFEGIAEEGDGGNDDGPGNGTDGGGASARGAHLKVVK
jgi:stringent starvation protein B